MTDIETQRDLAQLTAQFKELEDQYNKGKGWWGKDLRWLAHTVGDGQSYFRLYPLFSALVHSTIIGDKYYI